MIPFCNSSHIPPPPCNCWHWTVNSCNAIWLTFSYKASHITLELFTVQCQQLRGGGGMWLELQKGVILHVQSSQNFFQLNFFSNWIAWIITYPLWLINVCTMLQFPLTHKNNNIVFYIVHRQLWFVSWLKLGPIYIPAESAMYIECSRCSIH